MKNRNKLWIKLLFTFFFIRGGIEFAHDGYDLTGKLSAWERKKIVSMVPVRKEYVKETKPFSRIIEEVADKYEIEPSIITKVIAWESAQGTDLRRFEVNKCKNDKDCQESFDRMALHASHGPMHVMGSTAKSYCGISWEELYDTEKGINCGVSYLRHCLNKTGTREGMLLCYNGGADKNYPQKVMKASTKKTLYAFNG